MERLKDKVVIITGSARGIGFSIAEAFARNGAISVILDLNQADIDKAVQKIDDLGFRALGFAANVTDPNAIAAVFKEIVGQLGRIDVLINNAGITKDGLIMKMKESDWDLVLNVNLKGNFLVSKYIIRKMTKNKAPKDKLKGKVINVASIAGRRGRAGLGAYSASKFGVVSLTQTLARELGRYRITVNAICPGLIHTKIYGNISIEGLAGSSDPVSLIYKPVGLPEDVANVAFFLASSDSDYISGQCIPVSGGMYFI